MITSLSTFWKAPHKLLRKTISKMYMLRLFAEKRIHNFTVSMTLFFFMGPLFLGQNKLSVTKVKKLLEIHFFRQKPCYCSSIQCFTEEMLFSQNPGFIIFQDLPTFSQNLQRFVNDLRYYKLMNTCLPESTSVFTWLVCNLVMFCILSKCYGFLASSTLFLLGWGKVYKAALVCM